MSALIESYETNNLSEFHNIVKKISAKMNQSEIVLLSGPMGAGKTEFVKVVALENHCQSVASPTFAFHHHYQGLKSFHHWDLYRIENADELESTGFWDVLQTNEMIFIEWPEKLDVKWLPLDRTIVKIEIAVIAEEKRKITFSIIN